jgi:hypothetical protein
MTNLSSLPGFSSGSSSSGGGGGGGSSDLPQVLVDSPTLIDSANFYIEGGTDYSKQSSTTYQAFHSLASDGCFGGIFDPFNGSNTAKVIACGIKVDPSNGSIGSPDRHTMWNHSDGDTFSTCHFGSVGNMVMNIGHHKNPGHGATHKGTCWGATFNSSASHTGSGYAEGPWEAWPHSNGDLAMGANSVNGTMYARRSTYNQNDSKYWHNNHYWNGSSAGRQEWTSPSADTSTNYCQGCAKSSKDDLEPGGMIHWRQSSTYRAQQIYGSSASRGSELTGLTQNDSYASFHLSNGKRLFYYEGIAVIGETNGNLTVSTTAVPNAGFLQLMNNRGSHMRTCIPTKNTDEWIMASNEGLGFLRIRIDVNNNYALSVEQVYYALAWTYTSSFGSSGKSIGLVGPNDEYLVTTDVRNGYAQIKTFTNPFAA